MVVAVAEVIMVVFGVLYTKDHEGEADRESKLGREIEPYLGWAIAYSRFQ